MPCSAITLSLATITGIIATALMAIAFATDNWIVTEVNRDKIESYKLTHPENLHLSEQSNKYFYYTRSQGLWRICFPDKPKTVRTYLSPLESHCMNVDYFPLPEDKLSEDNSTRLNMGRACLALFMMAFLAIFTAFWTGVVGCWKRSPGNITATAILMLLACLLSAGAMGAWHGVEYYEKEKQIGEEYYQKWSEPLRKYSYQWYGWSFYLAWLSVAACLGATTLFLIAANCLRRERARDRTQNIQYIMPVYPQKQQAYAYATGYPAPAAYPAPYYHGSQGYGPYNY